MIYFTDNEIESLMAEEKVFNGTIEDILAFKESDGHKRASIEMKRSDGAKFIVKLRQSLQNINDFSAIFAFQPKGSNKDFKLRRYNGKNQEHTNKLEGNKFYGFHIHIATQRYQDAGKKEESYAEKTTRFGDIKSALKCLLQDCNIKTNPNPQTSLFSE